MLRERRRCWGVGHATIAQLTGMQLGASDESLFPMVYQSLLCGVWEYEYT